MFRTFTLLFSFISAIFAFRVLPRALAQRSQKRLELAGAQDRLLSTLDEFNKLYHESPCGYLSLDRKGTIVAINATELSWLGYNSDEVIDRLEFADILTLESRRTFQQILSSFLRTGAISELELEMLRHDGSAFPVLVNAIAIQDDHGRYTTSRWTVFDITTRKKAEQALLENQQFTRAVIDSANDAFVAINSDTIITDWNAQATKMFGVKIEEALTRSLSDVIVPEGERAAYKLGLKNALAGGGNSILNERLEMTAIHKSGREFPIELTFFAVHVGDNVQFCAFIQDITERREAEEAVKSARDQAIEASRFKSEFLANMSHEIRTPMNGILGMAEILIRSGLEEKQLRHANTIHEAGRSLLSIINDILDFSKIEAGKLLVEATELDPVKIVESVAELLSIPAKKKKLTLLTFVDPQIPHLLFGDPGRLRQILMNFAGNAIKFSEEGQVLITATLESETDREVMVAFSVTDTGIGMDKEEVAKLFQPFVQVDGSITRRYGGTGLGLSISKSLVELLGGTIGVDSSKGKGSKFWFTIPFERVAHAHHFKVEQRMSNLRVMVVDDEENSRDILERYVTSWGMRSGKASNAEEALEILRGAYNEDPFSIALIDLFMIGTNGMQLCKLIREDKQLKNIKLILVTAFDNPGAGEEAIHQGFDAYLTKPIQQSQLLDCMTTVFYEPGSKQGAPSTPPRATVITYSGPIEPGTRPEKILVVEDNETNQEVASLLLEDLGFHVKIAGNGRIALDMLRDSAYSLVFMDCQMPEMDGYAATNALRKSEAMTGKHIPVIAMTAHALEGSREQCIAAGMDDYLSKPIDPEQLRNMLERWLPAKTDESAATSELAVIDKSVKANQVVPVPSKPLSTPAFAAAAASLSANAATNSPAAPSTTAAPPATLPIDLDAVAKKYGAKNIDRLLTPFLRDAPILMKQMLESVSKDDMPGLLSSTHALKGSCGTVQAMPLREACIAIETAAKQETPPALEPIVKSAAKNLEELQAFLAESASSGEPAINV